MQTIFTETPGEEMSPIGKCFLGTCCPMRKKRGNQLKYFQVPQCSYRNNVELQPEEEILCKCQLFLEIRGCNRL